MRIPLNVSVSATFRDDGQGNIPVTTVCRAQLGPQVYGSMWQVKKIITVTTSDGDESAWLKVYLNQETDSSLLDGSYDADQDMSDTDIVLTTLDKLIFVWTRGVVGSIATAIVNGTVSTGR